MLKDGLYEEVINNSLEKELKNAEKTKIIKTAKIDDAEASKILARYVAEVVENSLNQFDNKILLVNRIISMLRSETGLDDERWDAIARNEQLLAVFDKKNNVLSVNDKKEIVQPETSIARSSLFTGAVHEPQMFSELKKEIGSCNRIDMLVSFIKWSGLRLIIEELRQFTQNGGELRVITTSYMGATDVKAIEELRHLPNARIKVSYDTKQTRLHAKTYVFYRNTGFTTAYVGSSNLSKAAISSGLEWNVKITYKDLPETIDKIEATFESYWNDSGFEDYNDDNQKGKLERALRAEKSSGSDGLGYVMDIRPYGYQQEILDQLDAERTIRGFNRNLVVAATGTGKTVISAFDYKRFRDKNRPSPCRLLFIAHREEILEKSLSTFRAVLKDQNFGELFVGNFKPSQIDYIFISIQSFNSKSFIDVTSPDYYDYIIVDEFHHAAAPSYKKLLEYYKPKILLGLTATPERMDGKNVLEYFNHRIAAEIRLPEAINRGLVCPFHYFGVTDTVDLSTLKWTAGGYDKTELSNVYTISREVADRRANLIINSIDKYVTDIEDVKALGFCVSVAHAKFMSDYFNAHNLPSMYLSGNSSDDDRKNVQNKLVSGVIRFIFVVDLYNEGVDIPDVNLILFLRPTESLTVFLQQLGRGLRLAENKECLTVLDFIGQAHQKYNFESKFAALLSRTRDVKPEIEKGFPGAPKGCYIQLEKVAQSYILKNIDRVFGDRKWLLERIKSFEPDTGMELNLSNFLNYHCLDPRRIYKTELFSRLCVNANIKTDFELVDEEVFKKGLLKLSVVNSRRWIEFLLNNLSDLSKLAFDKLSALEQRMLQMFYVTFWGKGIENWHSEEVRNHLKVFENNTTLLNEIKELLQYQRDHIDFVDKTIELGFECPLDLHCTYTRDQILVALDHLTPNNVREGVKWFEDKKVDVFFVTLNKADKDYSPTTMYNDYSINETLFHWQSQSTTSETSRTGQRYIKHKEMCSRILLFVREFKTVPSLGVTETYTCLGTANYVSHDGNRPINIVWQLDEPIPAKFLKKTNKLLVA